MKIQVRNDKVIIDGYVNAVERYSKTLCDKNGYFIERIMPNVFSRAIEKNPSIKVLLDHDYDKELANTKDGTAILVEDNIGLRATVEITDENVISKAKKKLLRGWSFGFYCNEQDEEVGEDGITKRSVKDIDLIEVSIIDDKKIPAYIGTSIEMRDDKPRLLEYRSEEFDENSFSYEENNINFADMTMTQKREILSLAFSKTFTNGWLEDFDNNFIYGVVDENYELYKIPYSIIDGNVNFDLSKQVKVIKGGYQEVRTKDRPEQSEKIDKIDYSKYELILKNMKEEKI
nr:MAG TPA: prohead serine protease [Caudoviricetes sp.]